MRHHQSTTMAILGSDTVVRRTHCVLLEGKGYNTILLDSHPTGVVDELLEGAHLLVLVPRLDEGVREAFVGAMGKSAPQKGGMPVIVLTMAVQERHPEQRVQSVPWPCETKVLVERIKAALVDVPAASRASTGAP